MALIIEDGTVVDGANSYVLEAELDAYLTLRGYTIAVDKEPLLVRAYDYMKGLSWCADHSVAFDVTQDMKDGQCEIAYRFAEGHDPQAVPETRNVKSEKVDVVAVTYQDSSSTTTNYDDILKTMPQAYSYLKDLLCVQSGRMIQS